MSPMCVLLCIIYWVIVYVFYFESQPDHINSRKIRHVSMIQWLLTYSQNIYLYVYLSNRGQHSKKLPTIVNKFRICDKNVCNIIIWKCSINEFYNTWIIVHGWFPINNINSAFQYYLLLGPAKRRCHTNPTRMSAGIGAIDPVEHWRYFV